MIARKGDWIQTYSGLPYWPYDPRPEDVRIEDIAHALSMLCRFTGHCSRFYSVAEHSVNVARLVPAPLAKMALLHDATEAYLNDLSKPLKRGLDEYQRLEQINWPCIAWHFGLQTYMPPEIHAADRAMFYAERNVLMKPYAPGLIDASIPRQPEIPADIEIVGMTPAQAEDAFLTTYSFL
jgi:hypothetical protein